MFTAPRIFCFVVLCALLGFARPAGAAVLVYDVNAWIDTTDYLIIHGSTLQWEHTTSGSPAGTHTSPEPTEISSTLDGVSLMSGVDWNQTWPSPLPSDAFSSTFSPLSPSLPLGGSLTASVVKISGRGTPSILQEPTAANGNTLIVQFTDGFNGAAFLDTQITVVPEPSSICLLAGGAIFALRRGKRHRLTNAASSASFQR